MRDEILKLLKESEVPLTELNIQDKLSEKVSLDKLCEELRTMEKCGDLYVTKKGKYTVYENTHLKVGKLSVSKKGFGFVIMENEKMHQLEKEVRFSVWEKYDETHTVVRFAASWATKMEDIDELISIL